MRVWNLSWIGSSLVGLALGQVAILGYASGEGPGANASFVLPAPPPVDLDLGRASINTVSASISRSSGLATVRFLKDGGHPSVSFSFPPLDLSSETGIVVELRNCSARGVTVFGSLNNSYWVTNFVTVRPGDAARLRIYLQRTSFYPATLGAAFQKMNGIPGGQMKLWPDAEVDASSIHELTLFIINPAETAAVEIESASTFRLPQPSIASGNWEPFVDRYGQLAYKNWPGKIASDDALRMSAKAEDRDLMQHPAPPDFDCFGGWDEGPRLRATGHFRVQKVAGRWWLVDPDGRLFWSNGITTIAFDQQTDVKNRPTYFRDPAVDGDFLARNLDIKYGPAWRTVIARRTALRLKSWGLNTIGPWSDGSVTGNGKTPYTYLIASAGAARKIDPYSRQWRRQLRAELMQNAAALDRDPWCVGVFVDNEIHESADPDWWEAYYRTVSRVVHQLLPHKLYLGSRLDFADFPNVSANQLQIVRIAARFTDVISFNQYRFTLEDFHVPSGVDRPVLVGEFHFGALDRGLLHTGLRSVDDQKQRAEAYVNYVESALRNPVVVGVHWFQMYDEPVTGRGDGENYQTGFLDVCDQPYPETIEASRFIGNQLYSIRTGTLSSDNRNHDSAR